MFVNCNNTAYKITISKCTNTKQKTVILSQVNLSCVETYVLHHLSYLKQLLKLRQLLVVYHLPCINICTLRKWAFYQ